jgi:acyl-CoA dehydrogenase
VQLCHHARRIIHHEGDGRMSVLNDDLFQLAMSEEAQPLMDAVKKHIRDHVDPITEEFFALHKEKDDRWSWHPRQLELLEGAKNAAK